MKATEEKKTFLGRVKSLFWKILNTIKSWFSSNDASKVSSAPYDGPVYDPKAVEECLAKRKAKDANQQTPKQPEGNGPEKKVSAHNKKMPQPEEVKIIKEAEKGKEGNEKSGEANEIRSEGALMIHEGKLVLRVPPFRAADIRLWENPAEKKEYLLYVQCGENVYRITGLNQYNSIGSDNARYVYNINSVLKQDKDGKFNKNEVVSPNNNMPGVRALLDLSTTLKIKITNISDTPFFEAKITTPTATDGQPNPSVTSPKQVAADNSQSK